MKRTWPLLFVALMTVAACTSRSEGPARDAGVNRIFATVRGVT